MISQCQHMSRHGAWCPQPAFGSPVSGRVEGRLEPLDAPGFDAHHVETARRQGREVAQEMLGGEDDAALLGEGDAACGAAETRTAALANLDEDQRAVTVAHDEVHLAAAGPRA